MIELKEETIDGERYEAALISVSENWKGNEDSQVIVYTEWTSGEFEFEEEKEYLLYPYDDNGMLKVINCGRNAEINNALEDLVELGEGNKPSNTVQLEAEFQKGGSGAITGLLLLLLIPLVSVPILLIRKKR